MDYERLSNAMFFRRLKGILLLVVGCCAMQASAVADAPPQSEAVPAKVNVENYLKEIDVTELNLSNGMRVVVKPTNINSGEVFLQLIAPGGYSILDEEQKPSAMLAAKIALESGLGTYSANELAYILYRDAIDLNIRIEKTHRLIDVTSTPESLESVFRIFNLIFTENRLDQKALETVIAKEKESLSQRLIDPDHSFDVIQFALNTNHAKSLNPLSLKAIKKVDLKKAQEFFKRSFTNPSGFILAVVGDIDPKKAKPLIEKYLAVLENDPTVSELAYPETPSFPSGVNHRVAPMRHKEDAYSKITIPLKIPLSLENIEVFDISNRLIERRLRNVILKETGKTYYGVDVGYELPLYPYHGYVWLTIQFYCPKDKLSVIERLIMEEVRKLRAEQAMEEEFANTLKHQRQIEQYWHKDDLFWQTKLVNYCLWKWDLSSIPSDPSKAYGALKPKDVTEFLGKAMTGDNYTLVTSVPNTF